MDGPTDGPTKRGVESLHATDNTCMEIIVKALLARGTGIGQGTSRTSRTSPADRWVEMSVRKKKRGEEKKKKEEK